MIEFEFPSLAERELDDPNPQKPQGLGTDSVYRFSSDVNGSEGLFIIQNQGTQPVDVYSTQENTNNLPDVDIFDIETGDILTESDPYRSLDVGKAIALGIQVDTYGVDVKDDAYQVALIINAVASDQ
ncbi:hypothetical protein [Halapricum hydrolyticum]|uniref:DUF1102 domain-containing protein n=1 Tax=Halapricum hydrolyticum TaxID=2979991 RepID=A0AAE3IC71_9EURY|nr:hypothetical protein [Halapricum hydrolyticum]MCU4719004.1 hypothetical protein [Halapricum hydrolyticum]MCU4727933.1 hypothetical protein [Halapricum hydrolyticum]